VIWLVASIIAGEVILYLILLAAAHVQVPWAPTSPGWFYFLLCLGLFGMGGTSFMAYVDTYRKLHQFDILGARYLATRDMLSTLRDMETGSRGYLLTGRPAYLTPYNQARDDVEARCRRLREVYDGAEDAPVADRFCALARSRAAEVENTVRLRKAGHSGEAEGAILTDEGRRTMETVRTVAELLGRRSIGEYNRVKGELVVLAETRIWMAGLVVVGSVVQMILGALTGRLVPPRGTRDPERVPPTVLPSEAPSGRIPDDPFSFA
jgi:CHASE3 domain sensor protein